MKKLNLNKDYGNVENFHCLINGFIDELSIDSYKNEKKILELCHIGKFLMFFNNQYKIEKISEEPDFIIFSDNNRIGLEHQMLIDNKAKEKEGFFYNLVKLAEREIRKENKLPNFLANVYVHPMFKGKINEKQKLVNEIIEIVNVYIQTGEIIENEIIGRISSMKHTRISLCPNMGAWWQKKVDVELIIDAIKKKENKFDNYLKNTNLPQWLLIVIGGVGESSFRIESEFDLSINTKFDKVYILEDLNTRLFEIK